MGIAPLTPISAKRKLPPRCAGKSEENIEYSLKPQAPLYVRPNSTLFNVLPYNGGHPPSAAHHMSSPNTTERPQPPPFPPPIFPPHNNHTISTCNQTLPVSSSSHSEPYTSTCYPLVTPDGGYHHPPLPFPYATGVYPPDGSRWYPLPPQLTEEHCRHHSPPSLMAMEYPPSPPPHNVYPPPPAN
ncbi:unnamed protein product [Cuscuta europaea]|uniref:Uncharacterized protein n=1 Tax=Cuscuta europaea TaxID=41803 RepID=A0A9P0Z6I7_CUSEU|nr:unnamed protein product [Cuscuta europaea]